MRTYSLSSDCETSSAELSFGSTSETVSESASSSKVGFTLAVLTRSFDTDKFEDSLFTGIAQTNFGQLENTSIPAITIDKNGEPLR